MSGQVFRSMVKTCKQAIALGKIRAENIKKQIITNKRINKDMNTENLIKKIEDSIEQTCKDHINEKEFMIKFIEKLIDETQNKIIEEMEVEFRPPNIDMNNCTIFNLTNIKVASDIKFVLAMGPKFCFPAKLDFEGLTRFVRRFESTLNVHFPPATHHEAYKQLHICLKKYESSNKQFNATRIWLEVIKYRIITFKNKHKNIYIARSDKGKHTVILYIEQYEEKVRNMLMSQDYKIIMNFSDSYLKEKTLEIANDLVRLKIIEKKEEVMDSYVLPAKFYALIKVHKIDFPARPITAAIGSYGFKMSKWLTSIFQKIFNRKGYHIKNSLEVKGKIKGIKINKDEELASYDVTSMFTSITIDLVNKIILTKADEFEKMGMNMKILNDILNFLLVDCAIFQWKGEFYKQVNSLAMGSPLSPILANIIMTSILEASVPRLITPPKVLCAYVDDTFCIIKSNLIEKFREILNEFHPKIRFTVERQNNNSIIFLDLKIIKDNKKLLTCWNRRDWASKRLLNFFSSHKKSTIVNTAKAYIKNALLLSSEEFFQKNKEILIDTLESNCFPTTMIISMMQECYTLMKPISKQIKDTNHKYGTITFIEGFSNNVARFLSSIQPRVRISCIPDRSVNHFSTIKDITEPGLKTNMVIEITCDCNKQVIVRHTGYRQIVNEIINDLKTKYIMDNKKCNENKHYFHKIRLIPGGRNNFETIQTYKFINYRNKNKLFETQYDGPQLSMVKYLKENHSAI